MITKTRYRSMFGLGAVGLLFGSLVSAQDIVQDDLLTTSNSTTPWQACGDDSVAVDVTTLAEGGCAYRTTPAEPGITYKMTCGVKVVKFASLTLSFLDADDNTLGTQTTEVAEHQTGAYSVSFQSPPGTTTAAIGIYGETGSGFQDCALVDATPPPEPTKGSIAGVTWFDENGDSQLEATEDLITGTQVVLYHNGAVLDQTETGLDGAYYFGNLDVDECYTITFLPADATVQIGAAGGDNDAINNGSTGNVCLSDAAPDVTDVDAGFIAIPPVEPPADYAICGVTWLDTNDNGVYDGNDSALGNVRVRLIDNASGTVGTIRSEADGSFVFNELTAGDYRMRFFTPDGHEITAPSGSIVAGTSYINPDNGRTPVFNVPGASNTAADSACTVQHVNGGYVELPTIIEPTVANDDSTENIVGIDFGVEILSNDVPCEGAVNEVNMLGHNVPGNVVYDAQAGMFMISDTTAAGTYTIEYGLRGACGSYDTATVTIELSEPEPPVSPTAPDAPICRVETGGSTVIGGVDLFANSPGEFEPQYNFYDRDENLVISVFTNDYTHLHFHQNPSQWSIDYAQLWEIEWNGTNYGYDQVSIHFVSAVNNGEESELTECARTNVSPIALDLANKGRIQKVQGDFEVDLDADGTPEALTEWFAPNAGILVTGNPQGKISGDHLFGNVAGIHADGFAELATLDENQDGQISGDELDGLALWIDGNSNTQVDAGEIVSLASHQIVSLAVNHYKYLARATKADGRTLLMEDVWLSIAPQAQLVK